MKRRVVRRGRPGPDDVERCLTGDCIGGLCPCLCHTSLKVPHPVAGSSATETGNGPKSRPRRPTVPDS